MKALTITLIVIIAVLLVAFVVLYFLGRKVKAGPKVMNLICDGKIFYQILPKQEIKATVSGIYITNFKRIRGPVYEPPKKKGLFGKKKK